MTDWSLTSWKAFDYQQSASYENPEQLQQVVQNISGLPPLVTSGEIKKLKHALTLAGRGEAFILQGGDCAERFADCSPEKISIKLKIMMQMSLILLHAMKKPVIRLGRIAGQYAKPRSQAFEMAGGQLLPVYRGDLINSPEPSPAARKAQPERLLAGYSHAAMTLNFIRALLNGGFADLHHPEQWELNTPITCPQQEKYHQILHSIENPTDFLKKIYRSDGAHLYRADFYTSHEALHLDYEQALTRQLKDKHWYDLSTHLPWLGIRTAKTDSAHVEFLRGIENPIGIKIGPDCSADYLLEMLNILNPDAEEGRILLITRLGAGQVEDKLPEMIHTVQQSKIPVTWSCDPMHGNTEMTEDGTKTRHFDNILKELCLAKTIHQQQNSYLAGVHFELTGENVTECMGGSAGISAEDLKHAYQTLVDPRLNYQQSLEMALQLAELY